jgi:biotin carboxyl carrier protein
MLIDGVSYEVGLEKNKSKYSLYFYNDTIHLEIFDARKFRAAELVKKTVSTGPFQLQAPMPGKIVRVVTQENAQVNEGDSLLVMEAMKMQNEFKAPHAGVVKQIRVREGDAVAAAQVLLILE